MEKAEKMLSPFGLHLSSMVFEFQELSLNSGIEW